MLSALLALGLAVMAVADDFHNTCDGFTEPNWDDCNTIIGSYENDYTSYFPLTNNDNGYYTYLNPPAGVDPDSLNCVIFYYNPYYNLNYDTLCGDYSILQTACGDDMAGGTYYDDTFDYYVGVKNNDQYTPPSMKRGINNSSSEAVEVRGLSAKRDGQCTDGSGTLQLFATAQHVEMNGYKMPVTGRLPAGSMYTIQKSDAMMIGVSVSVGVEAGFFDLFDASVMTTVSASDTVTTTIGVNVNVPCATGQEGIVYLAPLYTKYTMLCTSSDPHQEIDVYVPEKDQRNYVVECVAK